MQVLGFHDCLSCQGYLVRAMDTHIPVPSTNAKADGTETTTEGPADARGEQEESDSGTLPPSLSPV